MSPENAYWFSTAFVKGADGRVKLFNGWRHLQGLLFDLRALLLH